MFDWFAASHSVIQWWGTGIKQIKSVVVWIFGSSHLSIKLGRFFRFSFEWWRSHVSLLMPRLQRFCKQNLMESLQKRQAACGNMLAQLWILSQSSRTSSLVAVDTDTCWSFRFSDFQIFIVSFMYCCLSLWLARFWWLMTDEQVRISEWNIWFEVLATEIKSRWRSWLHGGHWQTQVQQCALVSWYAPSGFTQLAYFSFDFLVCLFFWFCSCWWESWQIIGCPWNTKLVEMCHSGWVM